MGSLRGRRPRVRIGAPDPMLTSVSGMVAVTELVERLDVVDRSDAVIGPIKRRRRGHTGCRAAGPGAGGADPAARRRRIPRRPVGPRCPVRRYRVRNPVGRLLTVVPALARVDPPLHQEVAPRDVVVPALSASAFCAVVGSSPGARRMLTMARARGSSTFDASATISCWYAAARSSAVRVRSEVRSSVLSRPLLGRWIHDLGQTCSPKFPPGGGGQDRGRRVLVVAARTAPAFPTVGDSGRVGGGGPGSTGTCRAIDRCRCDTKRDTRCRLPAMSAESTEVARMDIVAGRGPSWR